MKKHFEAPTTCCSSVFVADLPTYWQNLLLPRSARAPPQAGYGKTYDCLNRKHISLLEMAEEGPWRNADCCVKSLVSPDAISVYISVYYVVQSMRKAS